MKKLSIISFITLLMLGMSAFLMPAEVVKKETKGILAGFATVKITPESPVRMSGYAARKEPFKGIHDDIYASSVVFSDGEEKTCIITADVIGFSHAFTDETRQRIEKATGIPAHHIMVTANHNHGGPRTRAYGEEPTENELKYVEMLQDKLVRITEEADSKLQPVRIGVGKGECKMNVNRRARHADGGIWLGRNPGGICDHEVGVIRVEGQQGEVIGMLINWPCHATTGGQDNEQITGDWPGAAARQLEEKYPDAVIMITAGASGDINPVYGPNNNFDDIEAIGQELAEEVLRVNDRIDTYTIKGIRATQETILAAGKKTSGSRMPNVSLEEGPDVEIRISAMQIGPVLLAGISGELMTGIGLEIKENSPYKHTFIYTHCNGNSGYLCTDEAYVEGGYEPMVARTMPGTEERIRETTGRMIYEF